MWEAFAYKPPFETMVFKYWNSHGFWDIDSNDSGHGLVRSATLSASVCRYHSSIRRYLEGRPVQAGT